MILHSIVPPEQIFPQEAPPPEEALESCGAVLYGHHTPQGFMVSRVLSTDPAAYLDARLTPGQVAPVPPDNTRARGAQTKQQK